MTDTGHTFRPPSSLGNASPIADVFRAFRNDAGEHDLDLRDMRHAGSLEMSIGSMPVSANPLATPGEFPITLERLEGPIRAHEVPRSPGETRFRYFLDGAQKTMRIWQVGLVPVVVSLSVAGILERNERGEASLVPHSLRERQVWILPKHTDSRELDFVHDWLVGRGHTVIDPIDETGERENYHILAQHYGRLVELAQRTSNTERAALEAALARDWSSGYIAPHDDDAWLVVDGKLREHIPNAIGLVKSLQMQHLAGDEAVALFNLPAGHRTTAFRFVRKPEHEVDPWEQPDSVSENRTMWYQRFWDSTSLDAQYSLVRIEAPPAVDTSEEIDRIASWLVTERLPRATADPRWPTLLYPIHYLEAILKRRLAALTAGWPSQ